MLPITPAVTKERRKTSKRGRVVVLWKKVLRRGKTRAVKRNKFVRKWRRG